MHHEWVERYEDYEAVLVCINALPTWETDAAMRAFAIYQWTDATTSGDDPSLRHNDAGTIIRHEGGVLAIDFGHGSLNDALPDLFLALHALGWREAEVYHPAATLNALLVDMGRSIPPNLDFDVRPAKTDQPIEESPEAQMFIAGANRLKGDSGAARQSNESAVSSIILDEFRDLAPAGEGLMTSTVIAHAGVVNLIDDDEQEEGGDAVVVQLAPPARVVPVYDQDYGEEPNVPNIESHAEEECVEMWPPARSGKQTVDSFWIEPVHTTEKEIAPASVAQAEKVDIIAAADIKANEQQTASIKVLHPINVEEQCMSIETSCPSKIIRVGRSVFCFDMPEDSLANDDIQAIASEYRIPREEWVNISPGLLKESMRWDFLGEIEPNAPWVAETLAEVMVPSADSRLVAGIFLALKAEKPCAGLRDVLMFAGRALEEMAQILGTVSPAAKLLLNHAKTRGDLDRTMDALVQHLGALALAPVGQSFVDLPADQDEVSGELQETFTVREVIQSPAPRIFVVHVDVLDSAFVAGIAESLRYVATLHAAAKRYGKEGDGTQEEFGKPVQDQVESAGQINAEVQEVLGSLFEQLQKLGVSIPLTGQTNS